jgi:hypothetical protein
MIRASDPPMKRRRPKFLVSIWDFTPFSKSENDVCSDEAELAGDSIIEEKNIGPRSAPIDPSGPYLGTLWPLQVFVNDFRHSNTSCPGRASLDH